MLKRSDGAGDVAEARVAAEEFVAAQAGEGDLQPGASSGVADEEAVDPVARGLVHGAHEAGEVVAEIVLADPDGLVAGAVLGGDLRSQRGLVVERAAKFLETESDGAEGGG